MQVVLVRHDDASRPVPHRATQSRLGVVRRESEEGLGHVPPVARRIPVRPPPPTWGGPRPRDLYFGTVSGREPYYTHPSPVETG